MNCKICHKENPDHLMRSLIGTSVTDFFICSSCVHKISGSHSPIALIGDEIVVEDFNIPQIEDEKINKMLKIHCPACDTSLEEIGVTGRLGCEQCYVVYSDILASADASLEEKEKKLREAIGAKYNKNEVPGNNKIQSLTDRLTRAIKLEDYETASKIRDEINKLKEESNG